jgi:3-oxoacyl-[acyl-carrier-protein] synthase-3
MMQASVTKFDILGLAFTLGEHTVSLLEDYPEFEPVLEKTGMPIHFESNLSVDELATTAASQVLAKSGTPHHQIGALIVVTQSSHLHLPSVATLVHERLALPSSVMALDINQGCSGFVQGLAISAPLTATHGTVLLVCVDRYRSKLAEGDRSTLSVFSDASSAVLISPGKTLSIGSQSHFTDGRGSKFLQQNIGGKLLMRGADVFVWTRTKVIKEILAVLERETTSETRPWAVVVHQASKLVVDTLRSLLPDDIYVPSNLESVGNTTSSSIPILLAHEPELLEKSGTILLAGFGVGLSSSVIALRRI